MDAMDTLDDIQMPGDAWILVNPYSLEPTGGHFSSVPQEVSVGEMEETITDPVVTKKDEGNGECESRKRKHLYEKNPEEETLDVSEKRRIVKAVFSHEYRLQQKRTMESLQAKCENLKKKLEHEQKEVELLKVSVKSKLDLINSLKAAKALGDS